MTARSHVTGNPIRFNEETQIWEYADSAPVLPKPRRCFKCGKEPVLVRVKIPADLSSTGKIKWRECSIDACIAPIVKALQEGGIDMRGSCCGHGEHEGDIHLQDGRTLIILDEETSNLYWKSKRKTYTIKSLLESLNEKKEKVNKNEEN